MTMDKRTIIAFVLIALIVIFWDDYLRWAGIAPEPTAVVDTTGVVSETRIPENTEPLQTSELRENQPVIRADEQKVNTESSIAEELLVADASEFPTRLVTVETETFRAQFSTEGASLRSFILKPTRHYLQEEIQLISGTNRAKPAMRFWTVEGPVETDKLRFRLSDDFNDDVNIQVHAGQEKQIEFYCPITSYGEIKVVYTFKSDGYSFLYEVQSSELENLWARPDVEVIWRGGLAFTEPDSSQEEWYKMAYIYLSGNEIEDMKQSNKKTVLENTTNGETHWGAVRNKYFMAALIPETARANGAWMESFFDSTYTGKIFPNNLGFGLKVPIINGNPETAIRIFMGPLDDEILNEIEPTLKKAMTLGAGWEFFDRILRPISKIVLWGLKALHDIIPNYGICIIIFSILIKIIIWPLTRKSYQSMAAMGKLKPEMDALREKYKDDAQRLNKEIMALYKTNKVNPMGGCLPMLLQMPLLYALFIVFRATIEFRGAPFIFWINDLSLPDTIFALPFSLPLYGGYVAVLPLIMGITSFLQSKSTITDPNQKMMVYGMPIFMTLIFNQFPSGLTLYYTLFNVWTLVQQKITPSPVITTATTEEAKGRTSKKKK